MQNIFRITRILFVISIVVLVTFLCEVQAQVPSSTPNPTAWETNGEILSMTRSSDTIYIGGTFSYVGPHTGGAVWIDDTTSQTLPGFPEINGQVFAVVSDGSGGWFIGGKFTQVGGVARTNLAHILSDGSLTSWNPNPNNDVFTLALSGSTLYAGGFFSVIGGQNRNRLAALDTSTGLASFWNPNVNSAVYSIVVSGSTIYAGGIFTSVGGMTRNRIVAIDSTTGLPTNWDPNANNAINTIAVSGSTVYIGGSFTTVNGSVSRSRLAAFDAVGTGTVTTWDPNANSTVRTLGILGSTVYVGGNFFTVGGQFRTNIAAVNITTGVPTTWAPNSNGDVISMAITSPTIYVGGGFTTIGGGQPRASIAALDINTGLATAWNPGANLSVETLLVSGSTVFAGGSFTSAGGVARSRLAAFDITSGTAKAWNPGANNNVETMLLDGSTLYIGGNFSNVGGQTRNNIAAVDAITGVVSSFSPNTNSLVETLAISSSTLYAGGFFTVIGGQSRNRIAAMNKTTGAVSGWNPNADGQVQSLAISGSSIYVGGAFNNIGGQARTALAELDITSGTATAWNPSPGGVSTPIILTMKISGSTMYAGGNFTSISGVTRNNVAAINLISTGTVTPWAPTVTGFGTSRINDIEISSSTVFLVGLFGFIDSVSRKNVASIDISSGALSAWDPSTIGEVSASVLTDSSVYIGGRISHIGLIPRTRFAQFDFPAQNMAVSPTSLAFADQDINAPPLAAQGIDIVNIGTVNLTFSSISIINDAEGSFAFGSVPTTTSLTAGTTKTLFVTFDPPTIGAKSADIQIISNNPASPTLLVPLSGLGIAFPEIDVLDGATTVTDGISTVNFGSVIMGDAAPTRTLTVKNIGPVGSVLTLTTPTVVIPAASAFSVTEGLSASLNSGQSDTFTIELSTASDGTFNDEFSIVNNDSNENPFTFFVTGMVILPTPTPTPVPPTPTPTSIPPTPTSVPPTPTPTSVPPTPTPTSVPPTPTPTSVPPIDVTFPTAGALLARGDMFTAQWSSGNIPVLIEENGLPGSKVNIFVLGSTSTSIQLLDVPNTGSKEIFIPTSMEPSNDYLMVIIPQDDASKLDISEPFEIVPNNASSSLPWHLLE